MQVSEGIDGSLPVLTNFPSEIGLLDVLFPSGELFLWQTDRF